MNILFDANFETDDGELRNLLDRSVEARGFLERMWQKYRPYVKAEETAFRGDLRAQPHARIWEMYVAVALLESGLDLADKKTEGPDIHLRIPTIWVEAVTSTDGATPNMNSIQPVAKVPEILLTETMPGGPPEEAIALRWLSTIDAKQKKLSDFIRKTIVNAADPYVIAMNVSKTSFSHYDYQHIPNHIPMIVKFLFGYGQTVGLIAYPKDRLSKPVLSNRLDYIYQPHVNGTQVQSDIFFQEQYSGVSALIVSKEGYWSWQHGIPNSLSENFLLIHNPLAKNRIPKPWLKSGHEIWIERGQLHKRFWKDGGEHSYERFPLPYDLPIKTRAKLDELN